MKSAGMPAQVAGLSRPADSEGFKRLKVTGTPRPRRRRRDQVITIVRREEDIFDMGLLSSHPLLVATIGLMGVRVVGRLS